MQFNGYFDHKEHLRILQDKMSPGNEQTDDVNELKCNECIIGHRTKTGY